MRERKTVRTATWIVALLVAAAFTAMAGCGNVFGLSGYSFDETTLADGGDVDSATDSAVAQRDAAIDASEGGPPAPTCTDGIANGKETDVDCGGDCPNKCMGKERCVLKSDCETPLACVDLLCLSPNSADGVQDGTETDVDCGGKSAPTCDAGKMCLLATDCTSKNCSKTTLLCVAATSTDGIQNGTETDIDCGGGGTTPVCANGKGCINGFQDCSSRVCTNQKCAAPTATDGYKNGTETDVDCGGSAAPACGVGKMCGTAGDCVSVVCTMSTCVASSPADGVKNGTETDIDCGGGAAPACADLKACLAATDCKSGVCTGKVCQVPTSTDGVKNGTETDKDCGGGAAPACADGKACVLGRDCLDLVCGLAGSCSSPTSTDGVKNGTETDVDCGGGGTAPACADTKACVTGPRDCKNKVCTGGVCQPATSTDGIQNGNETDIDCGGGGATPLCADGKQCVVNALPPVAPVSANATGLRDCIDKICTLGTCTAPTTADGVKNGQETDVDCGGPAPNPQCASGLMCLNGVQDCVSGVCTGGVCQ